MDLNAIIQAVSFVVKILFGLAEKATPYVMEIIGNLLNNLGV